MTSTVPSNNKIFALHNAKRKGRIRNNLGQYLNYRGDGWEKTTDNAWFGSREQSAVLIARSALSGAYWEHDKTLMQSYEKMNPKPDRPGVYKKG